MSIESNQKSPFGRRGHLLLLVLIPVAIWLLDEWLLPPFAWQRAGDPLCLETWPRALCKPNSAYVGEDPLGILN